MSRRIAAVAVGAALLLGPAPAQAAGCVLATDPAGDAAEYPGLQSNPDYDVRELSVEVTPTSFRFRTHLERVEEATPTPGFGYEWVVRIATPRDGLVQLSVLRSAEGSRAVFDPLESGTPHAYVPYAIKSRDGTVWIELPYVTAGLRRGDKVPVRVAMAGPFNGIAISDADERPAHTGVSSYVDSAESARTLVAGGGCSR